MLCAAVCRVMMVEGPVQGLRKGSPGGEALCKGYGRCCTSRELWEAVIGSYLWEIHLVAVFLMLCKKIRKECSFCHFIMFLHEVSSRQGSTYSVLYFTNTLGTVSSEILPESPWGVHPPGTSPSTTQDVVSASQIYTFLRV